MAISVAPLTTTVMGAVKVRSSGLLPALTMLFPGQPDLSVAILISL